MLYATIPGAAVMFCANIFVLAISAVTFGLGACLFVFTWIGGIIWAYVAAEQHNAQLSAPNPLTTYPPYPPYPRPY